jgi:hypothetical protein
LYWISDCISEPGCSAPCTGYLCLPGFYLEI